MKTIKFKGMLSPEEASMLAKEQIKVHNNLLIGLTVNNFIDLTAVVGVKFSPIDDGYKEWFPVLKCTFNFKREVDQENIYYIQSVKPLEQFVTELNQVRK